MSGPAPTELADRLERAEAGRQAIERLTASHPELGVGAAYEVQRVRFERRVERGEQPLGYKLGLTSRAKQVAMGVAEPLWGRLSSGMLLDEERPLVAGELIHPRVEPEIAVLLGRSLEGATATVASALAATEAVFAAIEVLDSRFVDFRFELPDVIADNASAARVVLGGRVVAPAELDLQLEGMVLRAGGEVVATAAGAAVSGHPAAAIAWLARAVGTLPAGSVILTGGLTAPVAVTPGSVVSAQFATLGTVTVRCA